MRIPSVALLVLAFTLVAPQIAASQAIPTDPTGGVMRPAADDVQPMKQPSFRATRHAYATERPAIRGFVWWRGPVVRLERAVHRFIR